jgi:hypothetical protein
MNTWQRATGLVMALSGLVGSCAQLSRHYALECDPFPVCDIVYLWGVNEDLPERLLQ